MSDLLDHHPYFSPFDDPQSGVRSYILEQRVAPLQQTFYYTNPSISAGEKYLWFYTAFPPNPSRTLGVVSLDPARPFIRHFPQAGNFQSSPMISPAGDSIYLCIGTTVWKLTLGGEMQRIATLDSNYIRGRELHRLATHLTMSADGKYLLLDGHIGNHWFIAEAEIATGVITVLAEFMAQHNHAQFSPVDPDLFLIAHDQHRDPVSGVFIHHRLRTFLMNRANTRYECINPQFLASPYKGACHEWWMADGRIAYIEYDSGVWIYDLKDRSTTHVWKEPLCHAHCDAGGRFFCADQSPYFWKDRPCQVKFFDAKTGKVTLIDSGLPLPSEDRALYHLDPHPQFSPRGTWVDYTTTRRGRIDVALTPTAALH